MCGIVGAYGKFDVKLVKNMMDRVAHRGPDAAGIYSNGDTGLGHRRLSIMDPRGANQPLCNENNKKVIVANGEIYNFQSLRRELKSRHHFRTTGDSEVILHLFEELGPQVVRALDGMFAFAVADENRLFLARDPIGIKPLYYGKDKADGERRTLLFASELKALKDCAQDVKEFPPGTCYHSEEGFRPYYIVPRCAVRNESVDFQIRMVHQTLEGAVMKRLMSDVPLGAFLSGGLDSSIIAAMARKHKDRLHTFSVGIDGSRDIEAARKVSKHIDSIHHEYLYTGEEVLEHLPEIVYHLESFDQDLVRSAIPCFFCSRLASQHVKVILTGEGADELFAGYTYYKSIHDRELLHQELRRSGAVDLVAWSGHSIAM